MNPIEQAILRTILYADVFQYAMTAREIHHYLIHDQFIFYSDVEHALYNSQRLKQYLYTRDGYTCLTDRSESITVRLQREAIADKLWKPAIRYGMWLSYLPFVEMVGMTGALAVRNPLNEQDDFDYLLLTKPGRVWLARASAIVLVRLAKLWGIHLCPNYVLASDQLLQQRQDLFMAHEITQMLPIYGRDLYDAMRAQNPWSDDYLPNAEQPFYDDTYGKPSRFGRLFKSLSETLLGGWLGNRLEAWEFRRKSRRFSPQVEQPESSAQIDQSHVKGHFQDHGHPVLTAYQAKLKAYGLDGMVVLDAVGD